MVDAPATESERGPADAGTRDVLVLLGDQARGGCHGGEAARECSAAAGGTCDRVLPGKVGKRTNATATPLMCAWLQWHASVP